MKKGSNTMSQRGLCLGCEDGSIYANLCDANGMKDKNHMISADTEKAFDKNSTSFHAFKKSSEKLDIEGTHLNILKMINEKPRVKSMRIESRVPALTTLTEHVTGSAGQSN